MRETEEVYWGWSLHEADSNRLEKWTRSAAEALSPGASAVGGVVSLVL